MAMKSIKEIFAPTWWENFRYTIEDNFNLLWGYAQLFVSTGATKNDIYRLQNASAIVISPTFPVDIDDAAVDTLFTTTNFFYLDFPDDYAATIDIADGEFQINGGGWLAVETALNPTDVIKFRATSSEDFETAVAVVVTFTVNDVPDVRTWTITTVGE
jgi:hypothetical protein